MGLFRDIRSFGELLFALAKSPSARAQLRIVLARTPIDPPPAASGPDSIDVRTLLETLSVEELSRTAEEYFQRHRDVDDHFAKPFTSAKDTPDLLIEFSHVLAGLNPPYGSTILDFGAGTCWAARFLTQMGHAVIAMDVSPSALEVGRELFRRQPVSGHHVPPTFLVFDGRRFDLADESVDRIVCLNALHHVPNAADVLREMARVLKPGGIAGFSEPGPGHSRSPQSQYEMRHFKVIENDIVMEDIERWALAAGFQRLELAVLDSRSFRLGWPDYQNLVNGGIVAEQYVDFVRQAAASRRVFFLYKAGATRADSRIREGLKGAVHVRLDSARVAAGAEFRGEAEVVNTGANAWLPSDAPFGPVLLGVHLLTRDGILLDRDFGRISLPGGILPGESARVPVTVPAPPPGEFRLVFDLVSERVCWFEMNGSEPVVIDVSVES